MRQCRQLEPPSRRVCSRRSYFFPQHVYAMTNRASLALPEACEAGTCSVQPRCEVSRREATPDWCCAFSLNTVSKAHRLASGLSALCLSQVPGGFGCPPVRKVATLCCRVGTTFTCPASGFVTMRPAVVTPTCSPAQASTWAMRLPHGMAKGFATLHDIVDIFRVLAHGLGQLRKAIACAASSVPPVCSGR